MKTSDSLAKIAPAMLKAQTAIKFAVKDAKNPHFKSTYADLPSVIDAVKPALNSAGIVFVQSFGPSEPGFIAVTTRLMHESGEWIEDTATIPLPKSDPQGYGSAATYGRRYALAAVTGLYQDDDDGQGAAKPPQKAAQPPQAVAPQPTEKPFDLPAVLAWVNKAKTVEEARTRGRAAWGKTQDAQAHQAIASAVEQFEQSALLSA
jgi:hypothetical protein